MDVERELERLSREAKTKLEREQEEIAPDLERLHEGVGAARVSPGSAVLTILGTLVGAYLLWKLVLAPLIGVLVALVVCALVVCGVLFVLQQLLKADEEDEPGRRPRRGA